MAKKNIKKYYAIKEGKGIQNHIVETWAECKALVEGYPSVYKSFKTESEAQQYLGTVNVEKVKKSTKAAMEVQKKVKKTTISIQTRVGKDLYAQFQKRCEELKLDEKKTMNLLIQESIEEWIE